MMQDFVWGAMRISSFCAPSRIVFGPGAVRQNLAAEVRSIGAKRVLIVADPNLVKAGMTESLNEALKGEVEELLTFSEVLPEPPVDIPLKIADIVKEKGIDLIIGFGGGSSLDCAKGGAILATNGGHPRDYFGVNKVKKPGIPTILIPSTAGTGSEVTAVAVFDDPKQGAKFGIQSPFNYAKVALVDPEMTMTCPPKVTASSGMDALIHAVEAYTSKDASPLSDLLALPAIELIGHYLVRAYADGKNIEARTAMSLASLWAGLSFAQAGCAAVHACAYPLGSTYHVPHGLANSLMFVPVTKFNLISNYDRYGKIASLLGEETQALSLKEKAEKCVDAIVNLMKSLDMPLKLRDVGVKEETLEKMGKDTMLQTRLLAHNPREVKEEDAIRFFKEAY
ncbi:MAG TPA: iron-containing alcohol dehydrogenase [Thermosynergistes sp.]|nr:iron-containing alcohol dehydrogenase [Thermosynergistes sp.]